jgi:hypothetical protein
MAKATKVPKKIAGLAIPPAVRNSTAMKALFSVPGGLKLLEEAIEVGAAAAAAHINKGQKGLKKAKPKAAKAKPAKAKTTKAKKPAKAKKAPAAAAKPAAKKPAKPRKPKAVKTPAPETAAVAAPLVSQPEPAPAFTPPEPAPAPSAPSWSTPRREANDSDNSF